MHIILNQTLDYYAEKSNDQQTILSVYRMNSWLSCQNTESFNKILNDFDGVYSLVCKSRNLKKLSGKKFNHFSKIVSMHFGSISATKHSQFQKCIGKIEI